jgi:hypothetical protein
MLKGSLKDALLNAQEQAKSLTAELVREGRDLESAREQALSQFVLLPSETEKPLLDPDQMPFSQPGQTSESPTPTA